MDNETFTYDVFLNHSTKDKAVVRPLAERLKVDERQELSRVLLRCFSPNALASRCVAQRWDSTVQRSPSSSVHF